MDEAAKNESVMRCFIVKSIVSFSYSLLSSSLVGVVMSLPRVDVNYKKNKNISWQMITS